MKTTFFSVCWFDQKALFMHFWLNLTQSQISYLPIEPKNFTPSHVVNFDVKVPTGNSPNAIILIFHETVPKTVCPFSCNGLLCHTSNQFSFWTRHILILRKRCLENLFQRLTGKCLARFRWKLQQHPPLSSESRRSIDTWSSLVDFEQGSCPNDVFVFADLFKSSKVFFFSLDLNETNDLFFLFCRELFFSALKSGQPDFWKIRSTLFLVPTF